MRSTCILVATSIVLTACTSISLPSTSSSSSGGSTTTIACGATALAQTDEPNDTAEAATDFKLPTSGAAGTSVRSCLLEGDVDIYKLTRATNSTVALTLTAYGGEARMRLMTDGEDRSLLELAAPDAATVDGWFLAAPGRTYRLEVTRPPGPDVSFTVAASASTSPGDEFEPNDTREQSATVPLGKLRATFEGRLDAVGPRELVTDDWYVVDVPGTTFAATVVESPLLGTVKMRVLDASGQLLGEHQAGSPGLSARVTGLRLASPGKVYVHLSLPGAVVASGETKKAFVYDYELVLSE